MGRSSDRVTAAAGLVVLLALFGLALGGAAATQAGLALGVPGMLALGCLALLPFLLGAFDGRLRPLAGFLPLALLPFLAPRSAAAGALSGAPLLAVGFAGLALALWQRGRAAASVLFFPVVLAVYLGASARMQRQVGPEGDEPHYLMVADSLLRDGDLALEDDFAQGRYRAFHPGDLEPHYRVRGRDGTIYSLHAVGLSLLILPAYALGGYAGASFFMAVLAALLAREIRLLIRDALGPEAPEPLAWVLALSPPLAHYAGLVFTEVPAALATAFALRRGLDPRRPTARGAFLVGVVVAYLPWLNVRYAALALLLLSCLPARPLRVGLAAALPLAASAAGLAIYHWVLYGFLDPRRVYGARPELALGNAGTALPGLFFDQEFGLLAYAPLFALGARGLPAVVRSHPRAAPGMLAALVVVVATASAWPMWRGGFNPPARFLVPIVPILALGVATALRRGPTAGAALLLGWSLFTGITGMVTPRLVHRDRDGTAPLFREAAGGLEWTQLLPGFVVAEPERPTRHVMGVAIRPGRAALTLVWGAALALAVFAGKGQARLRGVVAASASLLLFSSLAAWLMGARSGPRDAVRLVGRAALELPAGRMQLPAVARWPASALGWGPAYEPHRHPGGAPIGERLPLVPGPYRLTLEAEALGPELPELSVRSGGRTAKTRDTSLVATPRGLTGAFRVGSDEPTVTLALRGGSPLVIQQVRLEILQP
jgi:hypothetical protein